MNDNTENAAPAGETTGERTIQQDNTPRPKPPAVMAGAMPRAIVPKDMDEAWRVATLIVRSGLAPRDVQTPERAMVAVMTGLELGLPPMTAIQRIAVINGRPCIWGDAVPAIAQRTGMLVAWDEGISGEGDEMTAHCKVTRRINSESTISKSATFSVADAKKAGLWTTEARVERKGRNGEKYIKDNDSPWYRFPKRMLQMRARVAFRDLFADAMCGLYVAEEFVGRDSDAEMRDVTPSVQPIIHNPLQDDADLGERPPRDVRDDSQPNDPMIIGAGMVDDDVPPLPSELKKHVAMADDAPRHPQPDHAPETGEVFDAKVDSERRDAEDMPEAIDNMAGVTGTLSTGLAQPAELVGSCPKCGKSLRGKTSHLCAATAEPVAEPQTAKPAGRRPRPTPRQAAAEPAGEPKAESAPKQPAPEKTIPGANGAIGVAFAQPWIRKKAADYEAYLVEWTAAWVAFGQDPNGLRDRYGAERTIRSGLGEPADQDTLTRWKGIATEAFKKLGGVLQ